jgi:integrase
MATLESVQFKPHRAVIESGSVTWIEAGRPAIFDVPQIVWGNNRPWREANLWAVTRASNMSLNLKTIWSSMKHLHAYAKWLEHESLDWWSFPDRESERCLVRFRGALIKMRDNGELAPSTTKARMAAIIRFYRWLAENEVLTPERPMWEEKIVNVHVVNRFGFERTLKARTSNLSIPNRKPIGDLLEDGLLPIPVKNIRIINDFAQEHASIELTTMLRLGFNTGMRFGTLASLKVQTIENAVESPRMPGYFLLSVGPGARPAVHTKFNVTGRVMINSEDLELLKHYVYSIRRLKRQAKAGAENRNYVFLTRHGGTYGTEGSDRSRSLSIELGRLRKSGMRAGLKAFYQFRFHQCRCTFATELARVAIPYGIGFAVSLVQEALLHKHESTSLKYIKFVEKSETMSELSNEFTLKMLGLVAGNNTHAKQ